MAGLSLSVLLSPKSGSSPAVRAMCQAVGDGMAVVDLSGKLLLGTARDGAGRAPVLLNGDALGFVIGPADAAGALALLLGHLATEEQKSRALAAEVLQLYRQVHLIEQLSEQLAAMLDLAPVAESALDQARRLIPGTQGGILVLEASDGPLRDAALFGSFPLEPESRFAHSILERGIAEIVNDCAGDPRALDGERELGALICAPLRTRARTVGMIALANAKPYSAADLRLLNTIALQTAAAIREFPALRPDGGRRARSRATDRDPERAGHGEDYPAPFGSANVPPFPPSVPTWTFTRR